MPASSSTNWMSPIAPRRPSLVVVPSSWTRIGVRPSRPPAQSAKSGAKRAFVTTWTASTSRTASSLSQRESSIGRPASGSSGFGTRSVNGRSRVAYPAARTIAFTGALLPERPGSSRGSGALVPRGEVLSLLLGQRVDLDAHRRQLEAGDLAVDLLRHRVDLPLQLAGMLDREL